jgi:hypothetical protein
LAACTEAFFNCRLEMLEHCSAPLNPSSDSSVAATITCEHLRSTLLSLRGEAALHSQLLRNRVQLESVACGSTTAVDVAFLTLPGEASVVQEGMARIAELLTAPLASCIGRAASVADLAEVMASVKDELSAISSGANTSVERLACDTLTDAVQTQLLGAVQERLLYATERDVMDALAAWEASSPGDIRFPERFEEHRRQRAGALTIPLPGADDITHTWFPPMHAALRALSCLYRALTIEAFATCAQQTVQQLLQALGRAAVAIAARSGTLHAQLFLISQLLVLREQLAPFDVSLSATQHHLQLPSAAAALDAFVKGLPGLLKWGEGNLVYDLLTGRMLPALVEVRTDGRKDLESSLKCECEKFIALQSKAIVQGLPLQQLLGPQPSAEVWAAVPDTLSAWEVGFRTSVAHLQRQLTVYLGPGVTHRILLAPVVGAVQQVLNKCLAAASSAQGEEAAAAAPYIQHALAVVSSTLDANVDGLDPNDAAFWPEAG